MGLSFRVRSSARMLLSISSSISSSISTSSLLLFLLLSTTNLHLATGRGMNGYNCKANRLLRVLNRKIAEDLQIRAPKMNVGEVSKLNKDLENYKETLIQ